MMNFDNLGGLAWLLAFGALFYWMMKKGGCGMGHSHAGHSHEEEHRHGGDVGEEGTGRSGPPAQEREGDRDPVCGMRVDPARAAGTRSSMGRTFYLCSKECLEKFDRDPMTYARRAIESAPGTATHSGSHLHGGC
jgi:YHS domain-containing protein